MTGITIKDGHYVAVKDLAPGDVVHLIGDEANTIVEIEQVDEQPNRVIVTVQLARSVHVAAGRAFIDGVEVDIAQPDTVFVDPPEEHRVWLWRHSYLDVIDWRSQSPPPPEGVTDDTAQG
jgi:hypothetical protein